MAQRYASTDDERMVQGDCGARREELVGQVIADQFPPRRRLSFIGIGRSGGTDTSERATEIVGASRSSRGAGQADELLAEGFGRG